MPPKQSGRAAQAASEASAMARSKAGSVSYGWTPAAGVSDDGGAWSKQKTKPPKASQASTISAPAKQAPVVKPREIAKFVPPDFVPGAGAAPEPVAAKQKQKQQKPPKPAAKPAKKSHGDWEELPDDVGFQSVATKEAKIKQQVQKTKQKEKAQIAAAASAPKRVDASDGQPYTQEEFVACYGDQDGMDAWRRSKPYREPTAAELAEKAKWDKEREEKMKKISNAAVVGAGVEKEKTKKELQDEKKAREKAEKRRKKEEEEARKRREQQNQHHEDPGCWSAPTHTPQPTMKSAKPMKAAQAQPSIAALGQQSAYGKLQYQSQHLAKPKAKKERKIGEVDAAALERFRQQMQQSSAQARPSPVEISFQVCIQGKFYPISELLSRKDFAHAPEVIKLYAKALEDKANGTGSGDACVGGFFIVQNGKEWANQKSVAEFSMASCYVRDLSKLLRSNGGSCQIHPYWGTTTMSGAQTDASVQMEIAKKSLTPGEHPIVTLKHMQKHGTQLDELTASVYDFSRTLLAESKRLVTFVDKMERACDSVGSMPKFHSKSQFISDVREKLPKRMDNHVDELHAAFEEFLQQHPDVSGDAGDGEEDD